MPERFGPHEEELPTEANRDIDLWKDSDLTQKIDRQKELGIYPPHVLITDRDGTHSMFGWAFKGTDEELEHYNTETARLNEHLESRGTVLIMNTGGSIEMMESGLADGTIPADAALVAGGSELFIVKNGAYVKVESYQKYIEDVIGYRREAVYPACQELVTTLNATDQADLPAGFKLEFQLRDSETNVAAWKQYAEDPRPENLPTDIEIPQPNKISFYCYGGAEGLELAQSQLQARIEQLGLAHLKIVHSVDTYDPTRYNLDLLPLGKREAADSVILLLEQQFGPMLTAVAGDAENDIEVILHSGVAGIAVGNRQISLQEAIDSQPATRETKNFRIVDGRLLYKDDTSREVGASLLKSVRALEIANALIKNRSTDNEQSTPG